MARQTLSRMVALLGAPTEHWRGVVRRNPMLRRLAYALAAAIFAVGGLAAVWREPGLLRDVDWVPLGIVMLLGVPLTVGFNAARFWTSSRIVGVNHSFPSSLYVTLVSMAANILPVPGGVAVRITALKARESTYRGAIGITAVTAALWVAGALALAGTMLILERHAVLGGILLVGGSLGIGACIAAFRLMGAAWGDCGMLCLLQVFMLSVDGARLWLCLQAIGIHAEWTAGAFLTVSSVAGSMVGVAPGGMGVRELVSALIAPLVLLEPEAAFLATAFNRLCGIAVLGFVSLVLSSSVWKRGEPEVEDDSGN